MSASSVSHGSDDCFEDNQLLKETVQDGEDLENYSLPKQRFKFNLLIFQSITTTLLCILLILNLIFWNRGKCFLEKHIAISPSRPGNAIDEDTFQLHFTEDQKYQSLDHQYDYFWDEKATETYGLVKMADEYQGGRKVGGLISMYHQMHCIARLRKALQDGYDGKPIAFDWRDDIHWPHCLDHLRQTILCFADDTIEREEVINGTLAGFINGMDDIRTCKNVNHVYELYAKYKAFP